MPGSPMKRTERGRRRIRARRENGQVAPFLSRDPASIVEALKRLAAGDSDRAIADDLGVSHQAVRVLLLDEVPEEYRTYQRKSLIVRIVEAAQQLEKAATPIAIACASSAGSLAGTQSDGFPIYLGSRVASRLRQHRILVNVRAGPRSGLLNTLIHRVRKQAKIEC